MVLIKFETDNDAFKEGSIEVARLLREIADRIENGDTARAIIDLNGNRIGQWEYDVSFEKNN